MYRERKKYEKNTTELSAIQSKIAEFRKQGFSNDQLLEIKQGLEQGVDAVVYARPQFSYEVMREIRKALADGIHLENYAAAGAELLHELHKSLIRKDQYFPIY